MDRSTKQQLKKIIENFNRDRIIVWGDFILDEYIYTSTCRVSREAPVLITEFENNEYKLGGAGNVVMNLKSLGAEPVPVGFIGTNNDAVILKKILNQHNITTDFLVPINQFTSPKKSRILSGATNTKKQQVLRIDTLNRSDISQASHNKIKQHLQKLIPNTDLIIISDYLWESVQAESLTELRSLFPDKIFVGDSRENLSHLKGIDIATPNTPELYNLFPSLHFKDNLDLFTAGQELLTRIDAQGIVLKRGNKGMIIFEKNRQPVQIDIHGTADIVDETGAGDTVISVLSLAIATGAELVAATKLANIAAGIVVMKEGAYPLAIEELKNEFR